MSDSKDLQLKDLVNADYTKKRFAEVMGEKSAAFLASIMNATRTNPALADADPKSVLSSAMVAATLDLPIDGSLGFAAIVPYRNKGRAVAQFQIMTKGFVQLALRTGQYAAINVGPVYADEYHGSNIITGDVDIRHVPGGFRSQFDDAQIVGYVCYFRLLNGYECTRYWTVEEVKAHGKRFSKSFENEYGLWRTNFDAMARKTVLKNTLAKWGPLSTDVQASARMALALKTDQAAIESIEADASLDYVDAPDQITAEPREPEDVVKLAPDALPVAATDAPKLADIKLALIDYGDAEGTAEKIKKAIDKAMKETPEDAVILGALLAKVKAACDK
jgi:recombination protein RecT